MFGLTPLEHILQPKSTLEKFFFLVEYAFSNAHELTTLISFSALGVLVALRTAKQAFKNYWFIYRLPEVLIVVVVSTSTFRVMLLCGAEEANGVLDQSCRTSGTGTRTAWRS